jgi:hypothetical protein
MRCLNVSIYLFMVLIFFTATITVHGQSLTQWDNRTEFALDRNPSGVWTYGYYDKDGRFALYNATFDLGDGIIGWCMNDDPDSCGNITINTSGKTVVKHGIAWEPWQVCLHPGLFGCKAVLRWTSPASTLVILNISVAGKSEHGAPDNIEVLYNGKSLANKVISGFVGAGTDKLGRFGTMPEWSNSPVVQVETGESIDIVVSSTEACISSHVETTVMIYVSEIKASTLDNTTTINKLSQFNQKNSEVPICPISQLDCLSPITSSALPEFQSIDCTLETTVRKG